jgi:hypothetical protein
LAYFSRRYQSGLFRKVVGAGLSALVRAWSLPLQPKLPCPHKWLGTSMLTDAAVTLLVASCTQLRYLWVFDGPQLTDEAALSIVRYCPSLLGCVFRM